ncbi:hypothetical protein [Streptomyces sp. TLI_171]|uniref:hypothetical protein n=1 Tax=Streptomyces sp. TLI_171 TaxID=1938859 RepID=UPI000C676C4E|nr:hypothetical protein [Streptomyces sp. TLI_171]RKE03021.1 hypothetical protein BX266_7628 [Streptomyces sp. TLI_171]
MPNRTAPRSARLPLIAAASLLVLAGSLLLIPDGRPEVGHPPAAPEWPTQPVTDANNGARSGPAPVTSDTSSPAPTPAISPPATAPVGTRTAPADLLAGEVPDRYLQLVLDQTQPADLPPTQEQQFVALADQVLLADLTGQGRAAFPSYFGGQAATAPWSHVRIQAGIARRHSGGGNEVDAHLVYAGTDPHGRAQERQSATIGLIQAVGDTSWLPVTTS